MKRMIYLSAVLALTMMGSASNGFAQQQEETMKSDAKMQTKANLDGKFMTKLAMGNNNLLGLGQTGVSKATDDEVKKFAQEMVDRHKDGGDLKVLAESEGFALPTEMDAKHKAENAKLERLSGAEFDLEYMKITIKDTETALSLVKKESASGKDADTRALADKIMPIVQGHRDTAKSILDKLRQQSRTN